MQVYINGEDNMQYLMDRIITGKYAAMLCIFDGLSQYALLKKE
jgi:hypothetical protein